MMVTVGGQRCPIVRIETARLTRDYQVRAPQRRPTRRLIRDALRRLERQADLHVWRLQAGNTQQERRPAASWMMRSCGKDAVGPHRSTWREQLQRRFPLKP
jgi:hypothetical protein